VLANSKGAIKPCVPQRLIRAHGEGKKRDVVWTPGYDGGRRGEYAADRLKNTHFVTPGSAMRLLK
jgi:hypothetical protein